MPSSFTESTVEDAALSWFDELGFAIPHRSEIAPIVGQLTARSLAAIYEWPLAVFLHELNPLTEFRKGRLVANSRILKSRDCSRITKRW